MSDRIARMSIPSLHDIASQYGMFATGGLRTDSISALDDLRIESSCITMSVAIAIVAASTVPATEPMIVNVCCRVGFMPLAILAMVAQP